MSIKIFGENIIAVANSTATNRLRIGTRGSVLARWQANWCAEQLRRAGHEVEIVFIQTSGDAIQDQSIVKMGAQGVFTKEIQRALIRNEIDIAVHSLKDLPTEYVPELRLVAVPERGSFRDAFVCSNRETHKKIETIEDLPPLSRIGTGSLRRKTQIQNCFGNQFQIEEIRGNVETRLKKLDECEYDAIILAEAGLIRLGFANRIRSLLDSAHFLPAVGQGAIGIETRAEDVQTISRVGVLFAPTTFVAVLAERAFLRTLKGGCIAPIGALGQFEQSQSAQEQIKQEQSAQEQSGHENGGHEKIENKQKLSKTGHLRLSGRIISLDGTRKFESTRSIPLDLPPTSFVSNRFLSEQVENAAEQLGVDLATDLQLSGAEEIIKEIQTVRAGRSS
ncbi:MAG: hydroxymethylbilane synthase [Thermoguttaceae bacterium]